MFLIAAAAEAGILRQGISQTLVVAVTESKLIAPLLLMREDRVLASALGKKG